MPTYFSEAHMTDVRVELRTVRIPLVHPFRTSRSIEPDKDALLVRWQVGDVDGWGECGADLIPTFFPETLESARLMIRTYFLPLLAEHDPAQLTASQAKRIMDQAPGNQLAKGAVEMAILDAQLQRSGASLADFLGGSGGPVRVGVSVGIADDVEELLGQVEQYLADGYTRVKLKIAPGWDVEPVGAVRRRFGDGLQLQVDANQAYTPADLTVLRRLDEFDLLLLEQPFGKEELLAHRELARRIRTPICLDESVTGVHSAATAIELGACQIINIKPARVGGYLEAKAIHDLCAAHGIPVFCGGLLETGIGRAANLALATLPNFTLPGDISATSRYFTRDITQPFELRDGCLQAPAGPGIGAIVDSSALQQCTVHTESVDL
jgi:O-succinylbenzoate synthase